MARGSRGGRRAALIQWAKAQALLQGCWVAIDGSKFRAVSSKRSVAASEALARYLGELDRADAAEEPAPKPHPEPGARFMRSPTEGNLKRLGRLLGHTRLIEQLQPI